MAILIFQKRAKTGGCSRCAFSGDYRELHLLLLAALH